MHSAPKHSRHGFSPSDLALLAEIQAEQRRRGAWGYAQLVQDGPADFLAVWRASAEAGDAPMLTIVRFKQTGTYALSRGEYLVTTGRSLQDIVKAIPRDLDADVASAAE